jgi:hypothetical protein
MGNHLNMLLMLGWFPVLPGRLRLAPLRFCHLKQGYRNHLWDRGIHTEDSDTPSNMSIIIIIIIIKQTNSVG